jgi:asparagine synthase (glutamine-hydrolysing)
MVSGDGSVLMIVNGEIYNFRELRKDLEKDYRFQSESDSEVILHGYRKWGIDELLERMDGMYAFAIYDKIQKRLYLARDRAGIKPLFYGDVDGQIVFASELKAIREFYGESKLETDKTALYDFLTYRYIPAPKTMYENVKKLEPATYLSVDLVNGNKEVKKYWHLEVDYNDHDISEASRNIRDLVRKSVNEQMMSDVPVGFFLSGGLDSSTVVGVASELNQQIKTYSIGFTDKSHDETHYADLIAERFNTNHLKRILERDKASELIPNLKSWYDEPYADFSCFPTYLVSKISREDVTVVLTGDGGDEVFGGYDRFSEFYQTSKFRFPFLSPMATLLKLNGKVDGSISSFYYKASRKIFPFILNDLTFYAFLMSGYTHHEKKSFREEWDIPKDYDDYWYFRKYYRKDLEPYTRLQYLDFHTYLPDDILTKVDRVSMAVSLECRVPLLSREIIEYLFSLRPEVRYDNGKLKGAMKQAFRDLLPKEILERGKKGFSIPRGEWRESLLKNHKNIQRFVLREIFEL